MNEERVAEKTPEQEIAELMERQKKIAERVAMLDPIHEDIIVIDRHDMATITWLDLAEQNLEGRRRSSWYGTVQMISPIDCGDAIRESKKKKLVVGDTLIYNPESAYSLNIAGFSEIWILHIDSVLFKDRGYDYLLARKENIRRKYEIMSNQAKIAYEKMQIMEEAKRQKNAENITK